MLFLFTGTDSAKAREKLNAAAAKIAKGEKTVRITDAHTIPDLDAALAGDGMFSNGARVVILDNVLLSDEMRERVTSGLATLRDSEDVFYMYEAVLDAATRKQIEKYAEKSERFDLPKPAKQDTIFNLVRALQSGKKKDLWVGYQREIIAGKAPEAIHGMLFYAAKDSLLRNPKDARARALVADLAALPHEARRAGFDLEYALERFVLTNG
jgi:hypothetical protein